MKRVLFAGLVVLAAVTAARGLVRPDRFNHREHAELFPTCVACHEGILTAGAPVVPAPAQCAACHDGDVEDRVDWTPRAIPPATNLRFDHLTHLREAGDTVACTDCHTDRGAPRMNVRLAEADQCVQCHGLGNDHRTVAATSCATCHVPLAEASRLEAADVARFEAPPGHDVAGFVTGHGEVDASCATCHTVEFCATCHVNAASQPRIAVLGSHPRGRGAVAAHAPPGHDAAAFLTTHGASATTAGASCGTCHTQESCVDCHRENAPAGHTVAFTDWQHGPAADAATTTCATCHVRNDCLSCHRPGPTSTGYHPVDFAARHPAAAYGRETSCSDCHNPTGFCAACHQQAGLVSDGRLTGGRYHDGQPAFIVGHGPSARTSLESCVSCHTETDCLSCHSSVRGRGFNPHGSNFDADRLRRRNPEMCIVCHGTVPGAD